MPRGDRTGPSGQGPETGKGMGGKAKADVGEEVVLQKGRAVIASAQTAMKKQPISKVLHVMSRNAQNAERS